MSNESSISTNFLADWTLYNQGTEAPDEYFLWSGLATMASIVGRKVWLPWGRYVFYPNLYVVLLGPPGNGKTSAMSEAKKLIRFLNDIPYAAECQTKEALVKEWATYERTFKWKDETKLFTPYSIFVTELSHFLGPNSGHMIDFLTTAYDQDYYDTKTKNKGNDIINGPCINLLGCTTPDWVTTYLRGDIISGGFTRRAIFINEYEADKRIAFPQRTNTQTLAWGRLVNFANRLKLACGEFEWSESGKRFATNWYENLKLPSDPTIRGFYRTKHLQVFKVAQLVALSTSQDLVITEEVLQITLAMFERMERNLPRVFQGMGRNELNSVSTKLLDILKMANGIMPEKQVSAVMWKEVNGQELFNIITQLEKTEQVVRLRKKDAQGVERIYVALPEVAATLNVPAKGVAAVSP